MTSTKPERRRSVLFARWCAYLASLIWAVLVLVQTDVTRLSAYSSLMQEHENVWGVCIGSMALVMMFRVWRKAAPSPIGLIAHSVLSTFWMYVMFSIYFTAPVIYPTVGATVPVVVLLHFYGLIGSQRWANGPST